MDPRIARTRRSLQDALLALASERPLDEIAIGEITAHAGVHRSTFSQHYADKETLLAEALDRVAEDATELPHDVDPTDEQVGAVLETYLTHIDAHVRVYRRVFGPNGSPLAAARVRERIELVVREGLESKPDVRELGVPIDVLAAGVAGSAIGVVRVWLEHEPREPIPTAARWVWQMLVGPLAEVTAAHDRTAESRAS